MDEELVKVFEDRATEAEKRITALEARLKAPSAAGTPLSRV